MPVSEPETITYKITWPQLFNYDGTMNRIFHIYAGVTISILIITFLYKVIHIGKLLKITKLLDNYSYEIYLVHHPFILGPLSLMQITNSCVLNIFIILIITISFAYALKKITSRHINFIQQNNISKTNDLFHYFK